MDKLYCRLQTLHVRLVSLSWTFQPPRDAAACQAVQSDSRPATGLLERPCSTLASCL